MTGFALYRFPHEQQVTLMEQTEGEPQELLSCADLNDCRGFVIAPFDISADLPILLIKPDRLEVFSNASLCRLPDGFRFASSPGGRTVKADNMHASNSCRETYDEDFRSFLLQLETGKFRKLVLARCADECAEPQLDILFLFKQACKLYPRLFVSLTYTAKSGLWLTATPEILLEGCGNKWRTIALAGTMKLEGEQLNGEGEHVCWSTKNIQEQRYVATYIKECLEHFSDEIREEGPRTVRAANLVHLRSDFSFILLNKVRVGDVLQMLHPTPAVCGLPKQEAFRFIIEHEHSPRQYYSGFLGPMLQDSTRLYVSLRCMQILPDRFRLYAGGGLLKGSVEEQEWQETEAKLETMRRLLKS